MKKSTHKTLETLSGEDTDFNPIQFIEDNNEEDLFLFLEALFSKIIDLEEKAYEKLEKEIGEDLASSFDNVMNRIYFKIDKNKIDEAIHSHSKDEMFLALKKLFKGNKNGV